MALHQLFVLVLLFAIISKEHGSPFIILSLRSPFMIVSQTMCGKVEIQTICICFIVRTILKSQETGLGFDEGPEASVPKTWPLLGRPNTDMFCKLF